MSLPSDLEILEKFYWFPKSNSANLERRTASHTSDVSSEFTQQLYPSSVFPTGAKSTVATHTVVSVVFCLEKQFYIQLPFTIFVPLMIPEIAMCLFKSIKSSRKGCRLS